MVAKTGGGHLTTPASDCPEHYRAEHLLMSDPITSSASPRSRDATVPDRSVPASVTSRDPSPADGSVGRMNRRGHPALTVGLGQPKDGHTGEKGPSYSPGLAPPSRASNFQMETAAKRCAQAQLTLSSILRMSPSPSILTTLYFVILVHGVYFCAIC